MVAESATIPLPSPKLEILTWAYLVLHQQNSYCNSKELEPQLREQMVHHKKETPVAAPAPGCDGCHFGTAAPPGAGAT